MCGQQGGGPAGLPGIWRQGNTRNRKLLPPSGFLEAPLLRWEKQSPSFWVKSLQPEWNKGSQHIFKKGGLDRPQEHD